MDFAVPFTRYLLCYISTQMVGWNLGWLVIMEPYLPACIAKWLRLCGTLTSIRHFVLLE